jgi:DNA (cytosine-5)-methyltransferase 1
MTLLPEKILSGEVEAPDLFCGGTPCQAFSVAGLRNSLDDARGNLSLTFVGIANAIDHVRSVRRDAPAIIFWENVPGVLNTKDNAFGCFLGALAGENDPLIPSGDKWSNAGCVYGPQRTVAWRVLDAQYFGVAQRRRRVFVISSARDDFDPAKVLFEFEGVRRDIAPSRETRQEVAGTIAARFGISRNNIEECVPVVGALDTECGGNKMNHQTIASGHLLPVKSFYESSLAQYREANVSGTIKRSGGVAGGGSETFLAQPVAYSFDSLSSNSMKSENPKSGCNEVDVSRSLDTSRGLDPSCNQGGIGIAQPIPLNTMNLLGREIDDGRRGFGIGEEGDPCPTLTKNHSHAVAQPIPIHDQATRHAGRNGEKTMGKGNGLGIGQEGDPMNTLTKGDRHAVAQLIAFGADLSQKAEGIGYKEELAPCLAVGTHPGHGAHVHTVMQPIPFQETADCLTSAYGTKWNGNASATNGSLFASHPVGVDSYNLCETGNVTQTLKSPQGGVTESIGAVRVGMAVRRLTPMECERLQGFPDGYTNIPWRKAAESPDGPRYKALGNFWAVPVVAWIGERIEANLKENR